MAQTIETSENFNRGPDGKLTEIGEAERWTMEFTAARERLKKWHTQAEKILDRYLDERDSSTTEESRLNLFTANIETQHSMLYGQTPKSTVTRAFADSADDVARVAGEMLERIANSDIEKDGASYATALEYVLEDRLLPGFGFASARYEVEMEPVPATPAMMGPCSLCGGSGVTADAGGEEDEECERCGGAGKAEIAPAVPATERKSWENVETDYHYWKAVLWSPCRTFDQSRWFAWCSPMTRTALKERFGEDIGGRVPMNTKTGKRGDSDAVKSDPWSRADVWEIWSKEDRRVYWFVEGFDRILDAKDDTLGLDDFYPFPRPFMARPTTRNFLPRPDFVIAQDLYNEIDTLSTRINLIEKAVRVAGAYDKNSPEVARLLTDAGFNKLYPAENWGSLAEKGGFRGVIDWFPLDAVTNAIAVLTEKRAEKIALLQQVTGWSDIMRGQSNPNETLGAQKLKTRFGGVRIERLQKEFARFASDLLAIKAEIIAKHYDVETIIQRSNVLNTPDAQHAQAAAQLIKDEYAKYRIKVAPEAIALTDFAQMKEERVEVVGALGQLFTAAGPVVQALGPSAASFFLRLGKWVLAGTKGSAEMEGEFDRFGDRMDQQAQQMAAQPKPPDPKLQAAQVQAQAKVAQTKMEMQRATAEHQMGMQRIGAEMQQDAMKTRNELALAQTRQAMPMGTMP